MKKDLDKRLKWLNGEIYDTQWHWSDRDEAIKDLISFMEYEEDEVEKAYDMLNHNCSWIGDGDYVFNSSLGDIVIKPLEKVLEEEFTGTGLNLIEHFSEEQQEEIVEYVIGSKNKQIQTWYNDWRKELEFINEHLEPWEKGKWDCVDYGAREDFSRTIGLKYTISYEHMVKLENNYCGDEDVTPVLEGEMPF